MADFGHDASVAVAGVFAYPVRDMALGRRRNLSCKIDLRHESARSHRGLGSDVRNPVNHEVTVQDLKREAFVGQALEIGTIHDPRIDPWA
jgi:hypothetical protein